MRPWKGQHHQVLVRAVMHAMDFFLWALPTSRGEEGPHLASYSPSSL